MGTVVSNGRVRERKHRGRVHRGSGNRGTRGRGDEGRGRIVDTETNRARHSKLCLFAPKYLANLIYMSLEMAAYCTKRSEILAISVLLGGAVSTVLLRFHGDQISSYFDLRVLHSYLNVFRIISYLLPPLVCYLAIYSLNALLVRLLGKTRLAEQQKAILRKLVHAVLSKQAVDADPNDLVEQVAWTSLKKFWRPQ